MLLDSASWVDGYSYHVCEESLEESEKHLALGVDKGTFLLIIQWQEYSCLYDNMSLRCDEFILSIAVVSNWSGNFISTCKSHWIDFEEVARTVIDDQQTRLRHTAPTVCKYSAKVLRSIIDSWLRGTISRTACLNERRSLVSLTSRSANVVLDKPQTIFSVCLERCLVPWSVL